MSKMLDFNHPDYLHEFSVSADSLKSLLNNNRSYRSPICSFEEIGKILDNSHSSDATNPNLVEQVIGIGYTRFEGVNFDRLFLDISYMRNCSFEGMYKLHSFRAYKSGDYITSTKFILNILNKQGEVIPNVYVSINHYFEDGRIYSNLTLDTITSRGKIKSSTILKKYKWVRDYFRAIVISYSVRSDIKMKLKELFPAEYDNAMFDNII